MTKEFCPFFSRINAPLIFGPILLHTENPEVEGTIHFSQEFFNKNPKSVSYSVPIAFFLESVENPVPFIPKQLLLIVNNRSFSVNITQRQLSKHYWLDITSGIHPGNNSFRVATQQKIGSPFIFVIALFHPRGEAEFSIILDSNPHLGGIEWKNTIKESSTIETGLHTTDLSISIICPLGLKRIVTPVRGANCLHISCFDFNTYLRFQAESGSWKCPICNQPCPLEDIRLDIITNAIIKASPPNTVGAKVDQNGTVLSLIY